MEIGLVASVVQVAGAGLKLSEALYKYAEVVSSADRRLRDVAQHVKLTSFVIQELGQVFERDDTTHMISAIAVSTANEALTECRSLFDEMQTTLEKSKKGIFGKLALPFKEPRLELLKANLERLKSTLQLLMQVLTHAQVVATQKLDQKAADEQRQQIASLMQAKEEAERKYEESRQRYDALLRTISIKKHGSGSKRSGANARSIQNMGPNMESENKSGQSREVSPTMDGRRRFTSESQVASVQLTAFPALAHGVPSTTPDTTILPVERDLSTSAAEGMGSSNRSADANVAETSNLAAPAGASETALASQVRLSTLDLEICVQHIYYLLEQIEKLRLQLETTPDPTSGWSHFLRLQGHERALMRHYAETRRLLDDIFSPHSVDLDKVIQQEATVDKLRSYTLTEGTGQVMCLQDSVIANVQLDCAISTARTRRRRLWNIVSGLWEAASQISLFRPRQRKAVVEEAEKYGSNPYNDSTFPAIAERTAQGGRPASPDWFELTPRASQSGEAEGRRTATDMTHAADMDYYSRGYERDTNRQEAYTPSPPGSDHGYRSSGASTPFYGMAYSNTSQEPSEPPVMKWPMPDSTIQRKQTAVPSSVFHPFRQESSGNDSASLGKRSYSAAAQQSTLPSAPSVLDKVDALLLQWTRLYER